MASNRELKGYEFEGYGQGQSYDEYNEEEALSRALEAMQPKPMAQDTMNALIEENADKDFYDMFKKNTGMGLDELLENINLSESIRNPMPLLKEDPYPVQSQQPSVLERLLPTLEETGGRGSNLPGAFGNRAIKEFMRMMGQDYTYQGDPSLQDTLQQHVKDTVK